MRILYRFWSIFVIATKRILSQPWMALATVLGMIFAISLTMSVPLYASSVYNRIFLQRVGYSETEEEKSNFPPFTFLFTYDSNILGNLQWKDVVEVNQFLQTRTEKLLGLSMKTSARYFSTNPLAMFPGSIEQFPDEQKPLIWSSISFMSDFEKHIDVVEGSYPQVSSGTDGVVEVLINDELAIDLGLQIGEVYNLFARDQVINGAKSTVTIPVRISGVYQAKDPTDEYWFIRPELLKERLMVPEDTYVNRISPVLNDEIYGAFWYMVMDGSNVHPDQAMRLAGKILYYQQLAGQYLPKIKLSISPVDSLFAYQRAANLLTVLLFAFSVPIFGLLLAFITMTAGMTVERQRNEIAVLRSRGAEVAQMIGIATVESVILGTIALAVSLPISGFVAIAIGRTKSFLDFSSTDTLPLNWNQTTLYFGLGAILLTMLARLLPTFRASRSNIVLYKRERARSLNAPLWQRIWLDVILLIPALYGIYQLQQSGSIDVLGASAKGDPFTNPLLIMVPALAIFAFSLLFLRILPFMMRVITWISSRTRSVGVMMAARHLARTPTTYTLPLVLLILTLSLSAFTATLAGTLDHHLHDQLYYQIGSDVNFLDLGDSPEDSSSSPGGGAAAAASSNENSLTGSDPNPPGWFFLPVEDYLRIPGVKDSTRVGRYQATSIFGSDYETGEIMGIDRYNLPNIIFWRPDFSKQPLGELMNQLAATPDGVLVPEDFMAKHVLSYGDLITLRIVNYQQAHEVDFHVVGTFKLFPTYYPSEAPLFVGNLDYIFEGVGGQFPYNVWLKTGSNAMDVEKMNLDATTLIGARTIGWKEPLTVIAKEQTRPERQGLFGVLSVGFAAAALLTVLGFLLYALLSYQRRFVELGVLRAIGLSAGQMTAFLASELAFLIVMGGLIGTVLGVWISNMFIPYLQIGTGQTSQIPPYVVYVAWPAILRVYALFGLLFVVALGALFVLLRRMKIFQAIKMGESV
jgi:putative ABC transport system permease protein